MLKKELCSICKFYAVSPIHAGSGASTSAVDLPIQRERHTNWPHIQASGVKGAFRAHFRDFANKDNDTQLINLIFGSDEQDGWDKKADNLPGAMSVSDARLLAFPLRSNIAPFIWVTCPSVLKRLRMDLEYIRLGGEMTIHTRDIQGDNAVCLGSDNISGQVVLEDAVVTVTEEFEDDFFKNSLSELKKLVLISDEMFDYAVSCCTEIQTNIKISSENGTAEDGSLRYQEFLPADSVLYTIVHYSGRDLGEIKNDDKQNLLAAQIKDLNAEMIKNHVEDTVKDFIQIGGDETLGKGICKLDWISGGAK
jgi:CRISPR-associated protein Cmr4